MSLLQKIGLVSLFAGDSLTGQVEMDEQNSGRKLLGSLQKVHQHLLTRTNTTKALGMKSLTGQLWLQKYMHPDAV
jgi:hypothetical protein